MIFCCFGVDAVVLKGTQQNWRFGTVATIIRMHFSNRFGCRSNWGPAERWKSLDGIGWRNYDFLKAMAGCNAPITQQNNSILKRTRCEPIHNVLKMVTMCWFCCKSIIEGDIIHLSSLLISTLEKATFVLLVLVSLVLVVRFEPFFLRSDCVCTCIMMRLCDFRLVWVLISTPFCFDFLSTN